jgi:hypothetical protein
MNSNSEKIIYDTKLNITTLEKPFECGCVKIYEYPNCTKQDLIHGGCVESCACFKCIDSYIQQCDIHKTT